MCVDSGEDRAHRGPFTVIPWRAARRSTSSCPTISLRRPAGRSMIQPHADAFGAGASSRTADVQVASGRVERLRRQVRFADVQTQLGDTFARQQGLQSGQHRPAVPLMAEWHGRRSSGRERRSSTRGRVVPVSTQSHPTRSTVASMAVSNRWRSAVAACTFPAGTSSSSVCARSSATPRDQVPSRTRSSA